MLEREGRVNSLLIEPRSTGAGEGVFHVTRDRCFFSARSLERGLGPWTFSGLCVAIMICPVTKTTNRNYHGATKSVIFRTNTAQLLMIDLGCFGDRRNRE